MNLNQLKYIVAIADEFNISKAAQKLFVSQPSLSQCVQNVERELGTKIFDRSTTPLKITYAGEVFIKWARKTLNSTEEINRKIADISGLKNIKLSIGISPYRSTCILPPVITEFKKLYPQCYIVVEEHPTTILHSMMDEGKIDILIDTPHHNTIDYTSIPLIKENILLDVPKDWNIKGDEVELSEFADKPFVMLANEQLLGRVSRDLCLKNGFEPKISLECHTVETAHAFVAEGLGVSFVPELFVKYWNKKDTNYYKIKNCKPVREFCVVYDNRKYLPLAVQDFIKVLDDFLHS